MPGPLSDQQFADIANDWVHVGKSKSEKHPDSGEYLAGATQTLHTREHMPAGEGIKAYVVAEQGPHELHVPGPATAADAKAHRERMLADKRFAGDPTITRGAWHQLRGHSQSVPEGPHDEKVIYDQGRAFHYRTDVHPDHPQSRESVRETALRHGDLHKQDAIFGLEDFEEPNVHAWRKVHGRVANAVAGAQSARGAASEFVSQNRLVLPKKN